MNHPIDLNDVDKYEDTNEAGVTAGEVLIDVVEAFITEVAEAQEHFNSKVNSAPSSYKGDFATAAHMTIEGLNKWASRLEEAVATVVNEIKREAEKLNERKAIVESSIKDGTYGTFNAHTHSVPTSGLVPLPPPRLNWTTSCYYCGSYNHKKEDCDLPSSNDVK